MQYLKIKIANILFLCSAGLIYLLNMVMHLFMWKTPLTEILYNTVFPLVAVAGLWYLSWQLKLCLFMRQRVRPILWNIVLAVLAAGLGALSHDELQIRPAIAIFPVYMLSMIPYLYMDWDKAKATTSAIVALGCTGLFFVIVLSYLSFNISALVVIVLTTVALFWAFRSMDWRYDETVSVRKCAIATVVFLLSVALFAIFSKHIRETISLIAQYGRPSLGSGKYDSELYAQLFNQAALFGPADTELFPYSFYNCPFAAVLAHFGWVPYILFLSLVAGMLVSGAFLVKHRFHIQKFYIVGAYGLLALHVIGVFVTSCGWDLLLFPETMPLMADSMLSNYFYLLCCSLILLPKQIRPKTVSLTPDDPAV